MLSSVHLLILFFIVGLFGLGGLFFFFLENKFRNHCVASYSLLAFLYGQWIFLSLVLAFVTHLFKETAGLINKGDHIDFIGHVSALQLSLVQEALSCHLSGSQKQHAGSKVISLASQQEKFLILRNIRIQTIYLGESQERIW